MPEPPPAADRSDRFAEPVQRGSRQRAASRGVSSRPSSRFDSQPWRHRRRTIVMPDAALHPSERTRPAQHAERPKGVPAARLAGAAFHFEVHRTRMRILERPSPVLVALLRHQIDRLGDALVWREARSAQVVESPQDVVVPARGKRTLRPRGGPPEFPIEADNLSGRSRSEQPTLEEIFLSPKASADDVRSWPLRALVLQQSFEHANRRME